MRVVLFGPLPTLDALPEQEVVTTLDIFGLDVGTHEIEPAVTFPDRGLELRSIQPALITVNITHAISISDTITGTETLTDTSGALPLGFLASLSGSVDNIYQPTTVAPTPIADPKRPFAII